MPVIKSAKKKLKQDIKKTAANKLIKDAYRDALKIAKKVKSPEKIKKAIKLVDKAAKIKIIHKNKAARIKSSLSKLTKTTHKAAVSEKKVKPVKTSSKKPAKKKK